MTLSTLTIISLLLAVYGLVAIIRDIVVGINNVLERRAMKKAFKEFTSSLNLESAKSTRGFYVGLGDDNTSNAPKPKRKYNKSSKKSK